MPLNRNRPWTANEDKRLLELQASGRSIMLIAAALKRSQAAVDGRLYVLRRRASVVDPPPAPTVGDKWVLEIYPALGNSEQIATIEFGTLRQLQIAIIKDRGKKFVIQPPLHVSTADRNRLLDLRAQGFDIAMRGRAID